MKAKQNKGKQVISVSANAGEAIAQAVQKAKNKSDLSFLHDDTERMASGLLKHIKGQFEETLGNCEYKDMHSGMRSSLIYYKYYETLAKEFNHILGRKETSAPSKIERSARLSIEDEHALTVSSEESIGFSSDKSKSIPEQFESIAKAIKKLDPDKNPQVAKELNALAARIYVHHGFELDEKAPKKELSSHELDSLYSNAKSQYKQFKEFLSAKEGIKKLCSPGYDLERLELHELSRTIGKDVGFYKGSRGGELSEVLQRVCNEIDQGMLMAGNSEKAKAKVLQKIGLVFEAVSDASIEINRIGEIQGQIKENPAYYKPYYDAYYGGISRNYLNAKYAAEKFEDFAFAKAAPKLLEYEKRGKNKKFDKEYAKLRTAADGFKAVLGEDFENSIPSPHKGKYSKNAKLNALLDDFDRITNAIDSFGWAERPHKAAKLMEIAYYAHQGYFKEPEKSDAKDTGKKKGGKEKSGDGKDKLSNFEKMRFEFGKNGNGIAREEDGTNGETENGKVQKEKIKKGENGKPRKEGGHYHIFKPKETFKYVLLPNNVIKSNIVGVSTMANKQKGKEIKDNKNGNGNNEFKNQPNYDQLSKKQRKKLNQEKLALLTSLLPQAGQSTIRDIVQKDAPITLAHKDFFTVVPITPTRLFIAAQVSNKQGQDLVDFIFKNDQNIKETEQKIRLNILEKAGKKLTPEEFDKVKDSKEMKDFFSSVRSESQNKINSALQIKGGAALTADEIKAAELTDAELKAIAGKTLENAKTQADRLNLIFPGKKYAEKDIEYIKKNKDKFPKTTELMNGTNDVKDISKQDNKEAQKELKQLPVDKKKMGFATKAIIIGGLTLAILGTAIGNPWGVRDKAWNAVTHDDQKYAAVLNAQNETQKLNNKLKALEQQNKVLAAKQQVKTPETKTGANATTSTPTAPETKTGDNGKSSIVTEPKITSTTTTEAGDTKTTVITRDDGSKTTTTANPKGTITKTYDKDNKEIPTPNDIGSTSKVEKTDKKSAKKVQLAEDIKKIQNSKDIPEDVKARSIKVISDTEAQTGGTSQTSGNQGKLSSSTRLPRTSFSVNLNGNIADLGDNVNAKTANKGGLSGMLKGAGYAATWSNIKALAEANGLTGDSMGALHYWTAAQVNDQIVYPDGLQAAKAGTKVSNTKHIKQTNPTGMAENLLKLPSTEGKIATPPGGADLYAIVNGIPQTPSIAELRGNGAPDLAKIIAESLSNSGNQSTKVPETVPPITEDQGDGTRTINHPPVKSNLSPIERARLKQREAMKKQQDKINSLRGNKKQTNQTPAFIPNSNIPPQNGGMPNQGDKQMVNNSEDEVLKALAMKQSDETAKLKLKKVRELNLSA